jgi:tetratricopeptide (TPR) repeat protein
LTVVLFVLAVLSGTILHAQGAPGSFEAARESVRQGDYALAEGQLRALLAQSPDSPEILDKLGIVLHLQGKSLEAIRTFEKVLKQNRYPEAVALLAVNFCRTERFDRALPLLKEAKADSSDPDILLALGPCYLESDKPLDAVLVYEKLTRLGTPPQDENQANLVRAWFDASRQSFDKLASLPGNLPYLRAIRQARENPALDARSAFSEAYRDAPYLKPTTSIRDLIAQIESHPKDAAPLYVLGVLCAERAAQEFEVAEERWPNSIPVRRLTAEMKASLEDIDGAIQEYEQILVTFPDAPPGVHFSLGNMYLGRLKWEKALEQYRLAESGTRLSMVSMRHISECLSHLGRFDAERELLKNLILDPDSPFWALRDFGEAEQDTGHRESAVRYLERASILRPDDASIHYRLSTLYRKLNRQDLAAKELAIYQRLKTKR